MSGDLPSQEGQGQRREHWTGALSVGSSEIQGMSVVISLFTH